MTLTLERTYSYPHCDYCGEQLTGDMFVKGADGRKYCSFSCRIFGNRQPR